MNETSFELAKELYELSGWEGAVDWFDDLPLSRDNYPAYFLGYLLRKLDERDAQLRYAHQWKRWSCIADDMEATASTPEDAVAKFCIRLCKQGKLVGK